MTGWIVIGVLGAGAARALWGVAKSYERMAAARDETDDSLYLHAGEDGVLPTAIRSDSGRHPS